MIEDNGDITEVNDYSECINNISWVGCHYCKSPIVPLRKLWVVRTRTAERAIYRLFAPQGLVGTMVLIFPRHRERLVIRMHIEQRRILSSLRAKFGFEDLDFVLYAPALEIPKHFLKLKKALAFFFVFVYNIKMVMLAINKKGIKGEIR